MKVDRNDFWDWFIIGILIGVTVLLLLFVGFIAYQEIMNDIPVNATNITLLNKGLTA